MTWLTPYPPDEVWRQWLQKVAAFTERQAAPATTTQPMETWSAATATTTQPVITEKGYRGYTFRFFQYVRRITKGMNENHTIHDWFEETRCKVSPKRSISALKVIDSAMRPILEDFIPAVRAWHDDVFGEDGTLVSLLTCPISTDPNTEVFSAVIHGNHLGRMEWLSFDLVAEACKVLEQDRDNLECTYWKSLATKFNLSNRTSLSFKIGIAPHKMRLTGDELEASAPGAGKRADFLLLAYKDDEQHPYVLGYAYHTTNVVPGTSSGNSEQAYPEHRVLWHMHVPLRGLMEKAATALATTLQLPTPRKLKAAIKKILDPAVWVDTVLKPLDATRHDENESEAPPDATADTDGSTCDGASTDSENDPDSESES